MNRGLVLLLFFVGTLTASAAEYWVVPGEEVIGEVRVVEARYEDTFVSLAREHNVGYEALRRANPGVDAWLPGTGTKITLPTRFVLPRAPQKGVVVNVAELRLYYFPADSGPRPEGVAPEAVRVVTHPISVGRLDWSTPLGVTTVTTKVANPSWYPPQSIRDEHAARNDILPRVVPPGPDNPLGKHALRLGFPGYLIHGTNKPSGVGMRVTHGCIRMFPEDVESMYQTVPTGTPVRIVNQPYKLGWMPEGLYLEAHPPLESLVEEDEVTVYRPVVAEAPVDENMPESVLTALTRVYVAATAERSADVQWPLAERIMQEASGLPEFISEPEPEGSVVQSLTVETEATIGD